MPERIQHLSAAMAGGDAMAVEAFYRQYFDFLYGQARRCTGRDESFCLDVVQDAVLRMIRTVKAVDSEPQFCGWLKLVVQTTAFDLLRSERRRKNREAMAGVSPASADADPDSLQLDWLAEQISKLDPELVRIIEMRFEQSWTLRRIGQTLGMSIGAVDGRLRRALRRLELSAEDDADPRAGACRPGLRVESEPAERPDRDGPALSETSTAVEAAESIVAPNDPPILVAVLSSGQRPDRDGPALLETSAVVETPAMAAVAETLVAPNDAPVVADAPSVEERPDRHEPALPEPLTVIEDTTLVGLEDEAGAYDDRL